MQKVLIFHVKFLFLCIKYLVEKVAYDVLAPVSHLFVGHDGDIKHCVDSYTIFLTSYKSIVNCKNK